MTGALSGIGLATAAAFAHDGASVVVSGRNADAGAGVVAELRKSGATAEFIRSDVRNEDDVRALIDGVVATFGRLDIAVNNAGTEGKAGPITDQTAESYASVFDTNVLGTLLSMKHELRVMQAQGAGSIINISSTMGHRGAANVALYSASKHAVEGLTKAAALEHAANGIRVNAVAPGPIETDMLRRLAGTPEKMNAFLAGIPMKRLGHAEDIAGVILFLASDKAAFLTGQNHRRQRRQDRTMSTKTVKIPGPDHPITITPNAKRVVVKVGGSTIADTRNALTLHESDYDAVQYIPRADVDMTKLSRTDHATYCPYKGDAAYFSIPAGGDRSVNAIWTYEAPYDAVAPIKDHVAFYPDRVDAIDELAS